MQSHIDNTNTLCVVFIRCHGQIYSILMWTMRWMHGCRVLSVCVTKRKQQPDWLTGDIVVAMQERDRHKSQGRWDNYKVWRNKVTDMIQTAKTSFYQRVIEENTRNPRQMWAHLREMYPRDVTRTPCIIRNHNLKTLQILSTNTSQT